MSIPKRWRRGAVLLVQCYFAGGVLCACKSDKSDAGQEPATQSGAFAQPAEPAASGAATSAPRSCPAGRWKYDYSDQALEVIMKSAVDAKVLKEEGEFVCSISEGKTGTITCDSGGKPVVNVVETKQAGMPMTVSVTITGKATTNFTLLDGGRMKVVSCDTSNLKIDANVSLAGKEIDFPTDKLLKMFGEPESVLSYKCENGTLAIKQEIDNVKTSWQEFTPLN